MRKTAIIFIASVLAPSLVLAWLAFRSLRDQEVVIERQRSLLYETAAQSLVKNIDAFFANERRVFGESIENRLGKEDPAQLSRSFDPLVLNLYPLADVGFAVSLDGGMLSPSLLGRPEARRFRLENERFLTSKETAEVYWNGPKGAVNLTELDRAKGMKGGAAQTEFRSLIGNERQGIVARYLQDQLNLLIWYRSVRNEQIVFGARMHLDRVAEQLRALTVLDANLTNQVVVALLNESGRPAALSHPDFVADWRRPFASIELGDYLPHWKATIFLQNPGKFSQAASSLRLVVGLLIVVLLIAIAVGGWLIFRDMNREMTLARQRTDFVSNVSHELKTPLTSIRMFSEMLSEGRVIDATQQKRYLGIITSETARLTRLINNVLDFSRMDRGDKTYQFEVCDLASIVQRTVDEYRPRLEASGFDVRTALPPNSIQIRADVDAVKQVLLNLLSNAEKYSADRKQISITLVSSRPGFSQVRVCDHGRGVPRGLEEKIFDHFFRAHDSLAEGIQGAGLGLALGRQIARAHGGDLTFERPADGQSCFILELPILTLEPIHSAS